MSIHNEREYIDLALRSLLPAVDRIIVADGAYKCFPCECNLSIDGTRKIVKQWVRRSLTIKYIEYADRPTQPEKRNRLLHQAEPGSWVLIIDGDELLTGDIPRMLRELKTTKSECLDVPIVNKFPTDLDQIHWADGQPRLWRYRHGDHYGLVHWGPMRVDGMEIKPEGRLTAISIVNFAALREPERVNVRSEYDVIRKRTEWRESDQPERPPEKPSLTRYRREKPLKVKPLMVIMSVRRIPEVLQAFKKVTFIDKVWFCNYERAKISAEINRYLDNHEGKYTHIVISSDDVTPTPANIRQLIQDVREYDLPSVAGYCNICEFDRLDEHGMLCGACANGRPHTYANVTFDPVDVNILAKSSYNFVTMNWARNHPGIYPVWFQGMACGIISMETHKQVPFRSWQGGRGGLMQDLAFAVDCAEREIVQFVDFRVGMRHYGTHHGKLLVGKEPPRVRFEKARGR